MTVGVAGRVDVPVAMPAPVDDPPGDGGGTGTCELAPAVIDPPPGDGGLLPVPMVDISPDMI